MAYEGGGYEKAEDLPYVIVPGDKALHTVKTFFRISVISDGIPLIAISFASHKFCWFKDSMPKGKSQSPKGQFTDMNQQWVGPAGDTFGHRAPLPLEDVMASISPMEAPQGVLFLARIPGTPPPAALPPGRYLQGRTPANRFR